MALLLLTNKPTMEAAYDAVRQFWQRCRARWGRDLTYFCWLELTEAGLPHYHAMWVNPPADFWKRETKTWLEWAWGNRFVKRKWKDADWFRERSGAYVGSYAKKMGAKSFQQNYDEVPRQLHTFMSNRLEHQVAELREHETRYEADFIPRRFSGEPRQFEPAHLVVHCVVEHQCGEIGLRYVKKSERRRVTRRAPGRRLIGRVNQTAPSATLCTVGNASEMWPEAKPPPRAPASCAPWRVAEYLAWLLEDPDVMSSCGQEEGARRGLASQLELFGAPLLNTKKPLDLGASKHQVQGSASQEAVCAPPT